MIAALHTPPPPHGGGEPLERAVQQAVDLRKTVLELGDPILRELIDRYLFELGMHIGRRARGA